MAGGAAVIDVTIAGREAAHADGWERVWGTASGAAGPHDGVIGVAHDHPWTSEFEVIGPVDGTHDAVLVDTENRGGRSTYAMIEPEVRAANVAYARIQWQTGHAAGVPDDAQGVGLVILREFGWWLRGRFRVLVLAGASQSAWCVNTFVAEVALSPCGTASIDDVCGNFGGWQPFSSDELRARYGEPDEYADRYSGAYSALVAQGFAMASERDAAVAGARRAYVDALNPPG